MITLTREEAQQALDALEQTTCLGVPGLKFEPEYYALIETLRTRLAQPEPKDDGHCQACDGDHCTAKTGCVALSNPPQREWQGLTDEELNEIYNQDGLIYKPLKFYRAIEAKLKEKNT